MRTIQSVLRRSYAAVAVPLCRHPFASSFSPTYGPTVFVTPSVRSAIRTRLYATKSSFQPPEPPGTHDFPVFSDIETNTDQPSADTELRRNDPNSVFVVTGASRGIGLQFVKTLLETTKGTIVACCRIPEQATTLQSLQDNDVGGRLQIVQLDLEDQASIETAGSIIGNQFGRVDLLLNVAGLLGDGTSTPGPERSLSKMDRDWFEKTLAVNLIGPVMFSKELLPYLKQKRRRSSSDSDVRPHAIVANLSARVGSISDNGLGGWYSYRMSKSALNQATRTMALELKRHSAWAIALHPGTTDTDLSTPFQKNVKPGSLFPVEFTVERLLAVIDGMEEKHSGGFYDWAGKAISF